MKEHQWQSRTSSVFWNFASGVPYFTPSKNQYYEQVEGAATGSPISPIVANLYMDEFWDKSHQHITTPSFDLEEVCGWYLFNYQGSPQTRVLGAHKFHRPSHSVHQWGLQGWWIHALSGHVDNPYRKWEAEYNCLQEAYPHRYVSKMGQSPPHFFKV